MNKPEIIKEFWYKSVRSGGPGGQHTNKVSSKVQVFFDLSKSAALTEKEKAMLRTRLKNKLIRGHILKLESDEHRSQFQNKKTVTERMLFLIEKSLIPSKKRIPTKPSKSAVKQRLEKKKQHSLKKALRRKLF